jgi:hypothetical protein
MSPRYCYSHFLSFLSLQSLLTSTQLCSARSCVPASSNSTTTESLPTRFRRISYRPQGGPERGLDSLCQHHIGQGQCKPRTAPIALCCHRNASLCRASPRHQSRELAARARERCHQRQASGPRRLGCCMSRTAAQSHFADIGVCSGRRVPISLGRSGQGRCMGLHVQGCRADHMPPLNKDTSASPAKRRDPSKKSEHIPCDTCMARATSRVHSQRLGHGHHLRAGYEGARPSKVSCKPQKCVAAATRPRSNSLPRLLPKQGRLRSQGRRPSRPSQHAHMQRRPPGQTPSKASRMGRTERCPRLLLSTHVHNQREDVASPTAFPVSRTPPLPSNASSTSTHRWPQQPGRPHFMRQPASPPSAAANHAKPSAPFAVNSRDRRTAPCSDAELTSASYKVPPAFQSRPTTCRRPSTSGTGKANPEEPLTLANEAFNESQEKGPGDLKEGQRPTPPPSPSYSSGTTMNVRNPAHADERASNGIPTKPNGQQQRRRSRPSSLVQQVQLGLLPKTLSCSTKKMP